MCHVNGENNKNPIVPQQKIHAHSENDLNTNNPTVNEKEALVIKQKQNQSSNHMDAVLTERKGDMTNLLTK